MPAWLLPMLLTAGMTAAKGVADNAAANKTLKWQNRKSAELAAMQGREFDQRMGLVRGSDGRVDDLLKRQYDDISGLEDETFWEMLRGSQAGFDEQQTIAGSAFDEQMGALDGLMTAQRRSRLETQALTQAEEARQRAFQDDADGRAAALPGQIGYDAQQLGYGDALARRSGFAAANMSGPESASSSVGGDPLMRREFERQQQRGYGEALTDATNAAKVSAYGDAYAGSERKLGDFAGAIDLITRQAANSRQALPFEHAVPAFDRRNAEMDYDFTVGMSEDGARRRGLAAGDFRDNEATARERYARGWGSALESFFGNQLGTESTFTDRMIGSSNQYENKLVNLGNYRIQNASTFSPASLLLSAINSGYQGYQAGKKGG